MKLRTILVLLCVVSISVRSTERHFRLVLLYATCSLNKDYLSPYSPKIRYTPKLRAFARDSIVFDKHQSESPFSGAGYASLFTGTYVYHHGIYYHPMRLSDEKYLIAEAFQENNYETFFWNAHDLASSKLNFAQGVPAKNIFHSHPADGISLRFQDERFRSILSHLKTDPDYKAFIQVNFSMTHAPYSNTSDIATTEGFCNEYPKECQGITKADLLRYVPLYQSNHVKLQYGFEETIESLRLTPQQIRKLAAVVEVMYKSNVHKLDAAFGKTIKAIQFAGLWDESLVIFTSDHGELLYRDDSIVKWFHSEVEPEILNIPLIIHLADAKEQGTHYSQLTRAVDVFPTVASFCRIRIRHPLDGENLSGYVLNGLPAPELPAYSCSELSHPAVKTDDPKKMTVQVRFGDLLYRMNPEKERSGLQVFDLAKPNWSKLVSPNLSPREQMEIRNLLQNYRKQLVRSYKIPDDHSDWQEVVENLRSLGYLDS